MTVSFTRAHNIHIKILGFELLKTKKKRMHLFPITGNGILEKMPDNLRSIKIKDYKVRWLEFPQIK